MTDSFGAALIRPGDDAWYLDNKGIWPLAQIAVNRDTCAIAVGVDGDEYPYYDDDDPRCRLYRYGGGRWSCAEMRARLASMSLCRESGWDEDGLAVMGKDGQLWILGEHAFKDHIDHPDAHVMEQLRLLGGRLYAAGHGGKLFRRDRDGWHRDDAGLLGAETPVPRPRAGDHGAGRFGITDLVLTPDGHDFYASGRAHIARPALFWRPAGQNWTWLGLDPAKTEFDQIRLGRLYAETPEVVWVTTNKGYLLKGNGRVGFKVGTTTARHQDGRLISFGSVVRYGEHLYAGGSAVCRLQADGTLERLVGPPQASMDRPDEVSTEIVGSLGVAEGVLWAVSFGVLSRFDGNTWERIPMPTVYRNSP